MPTSWAPGAGMSAAHEPSNRGSTAACRRRRIRSARMSRRRKHWGWGFEDEQPRAEDLAQAGARRRRRGAGGGGGRGGDRGGGAGGGPGGGRRRPPPGEENPGRASSTTR